jgi:hypothetical protein
MEDRCVCWLLDYSGEKLDGNIHENASFADKTIAGSRNLGYESLLLNCEWEFVNRMLEKKFSSGLASTRGEANEYVSCTFNLFVGL